MKRLLTMACVGVLSAQFVFAQPKLQLQIRAAGDGAPGSLTVAEAAIVNGEEPPIAYFTDQQVVVRATLAVPGAQVATDLPEGWETRISWYLRSEAEPEATAMEAAPRLVGRGYAVDSLRTPDVTTRPTNRLLPGDVLECQVSFGLLPSGAYRIGASIEIDGASARAVHDVRVRVKDPNESDVTRRAWLLANTGKYRTFDEAVGPMTELAGLSPLNPRPLEILAMKALNEDRLEDSRHYFALALERLRPSLDASKDTNEARKRELELTLVARVYDYAAANRDTLALRVTDGYSRMSLQFTWVDRATGQPLGAADLQTPEKMLPISKLTVIQ